MRQTTGDSNDHVDDMFITNRDTSAEIRTECRRRFPSQAFQARQVLTDKHPSRDSDVRKYAEA